ncbi:MAG: hypothetical protein FWC10_02315 [Lentimicrobiaceae bacterium]|nr:hypothetical protein [Lentimicrobiaceae bacterium]
MKKIFLLSLLSVLFLSAFSQNFNSNNTTNVEILEKIHIITSMDDEEGVLAMERGWWIFFYKNVKTTKLPNGTIQLNCSGWGWKVCLPYLYSSSGNISSILDEILEELITESNEQIARGEFHGTISKKIAIPGTIPGERELFLLFLMNWKNDPEKPYNGEAEIIISKTNKLGF